MTRSRYLPAIDGLRAIAVLAVVGFHAAVPGLFGGYLGVEVFFVVSGFLITALLLAEQAKTARIDLPSFWLRRARRLLPALAALIFVALLLSVTLAPDALAQTRADAAAAAVYASNWLQIVSHRSYFMEIDRPPLLQHLWSLAVEEQFYLIWPLIVVVLARYGRRKVGAIALLGSVLSALWMARLFDPSLDRTRVYVGSDTRASGLLMGAALAALLHAPLGLQGGALGRAARLCREALACVGLGFLVWAFTHVDGQAAFVYRGGLFLVDLASCALLAGIATPTLLSQFLGASPLVWLGRRSYGLYLWHWPIFAVTRGELDVAASGARLLALRIGLTFVASEACYRLVEVPVRRGALERSARKHPVLVGAGALLLASGGAALIFMSGSRLANADTSAVGDDAASRAVVTANPALAARLDSAAPIATPDYGIALEPAWPRTLTLLSDSVTLALRTALPAALPGWRVEILGRPALMVKQAVPEFLNARGVGSVVVIGLGYNSLFEKNHKDQERWNGVWDRSAERLISDLKACGAKKLVWITLREPTPELVTESGRDQFERYAWFFPYVNERIRALARRHPELAIADWQAVSRVPGITRDLIHLSPAGVTLMTSTVTEAVLGSAAWR
jgi:peptidoglycan/LPS O-acetylase OafA/YrhL